MGTFWFVVIWCVRCHCGEFVCVCLLSVGLGCALRCFVLVCIALTCVAVLSGVVLNCVV